MSRPESEWLTKICPFLSSGQPEFNHCQGSTCAAWESQSGDSYRYLRAVSFIKEALAQGLSIEFHPACNQVDFSWDITNPDRAKTPKGWLYHAIARMPIPPAGDCRAMRA